MPTERTPHEETVGEIEDSFGFAPSYLEVLPDRALVDEWPNLRRFLFEETERMPTTSRRTRRTDHEPTETNMDAHKLDCEAAESDCRFVVQSEDESEAIELARNHMHEIHGKEFGDDELREEYLQVV